MADWSREASEYLDGYLKQVAVLIRARGDDVDEVIAGLRDHIANELEPDGGTVTLDRLLGVMGSLGSVEDVANIETVRLKSTPAAASPPPLKAPPTVPPITKSVVAHRSPLSCVLAIILAAGAAVVALAVLGMVASILLPAVSRSQEAARRASCQNNLKQIGLGLLMVANENDDQFPPVDLHYSSIMFDIDALAPDYISDLTVFVCPSGSNAGVDPAETGGEYTFDHDYVFISHVIKSGHEGLGYLRAVAEAKRTGTPLGDTIVLEDGTVLPRTASGLSGVSDKDIPIIIERPGHHIPDGINVVFLDGHVEFVRLGDGDNRMWSSEFVEALENANSPG